MPQTDTLRLQFDAFELNEGDARLTRAGQPVALAPKAFGVLCALARQRGMLVTKSALLDEVWGHQHVSESVLKSTISELRAALADDAKQPRFIETASRRGYRFIGAGRAPSAPPRIEPVPESSESPSIVGRADALVRLRESWHSAQSGRRQVFWLAGEAGVGKTTLLNSFVETSGAAVVAYGQCVEQTGAGEPYLPILEALGELSRVDPAMVALMRNVAPTWLVQLPWLSNESERNGLARELAGSGPQRMLRELAELFDQYTRERSLLLVTEDLHWSDHATVRLIDFMARRRNPARFMWLATFRLAEIISENHPLKALRHELRMHHLCEEIVLDPFSEREVADYVGRRFPDAGISENFIRSLHSHTDGLPLFVVNIIDDLLSQGRAGSLEDSRIALQQVPENLAGVIEKQIARLPAEVQAMLEAASVCGVEFRPQTAADALSREVAWVSDCCEQLARQRHWLGAAALGTHADGSLDARFSFRHALYRNVFYQRIGTLTRAQLHRRVAESLERHHASTTAPAELALHFERSHDLAKALRHYAQAAGNALRQFAPTEAVNLTTHALVLLPRVADVDERLRLELALVTPRAAACTQLMGVASEEAKAAFERASALCDVLPHTSARAMELTGLGWVQYSRGEFAQSFALAQRIHTQARAQANPIVEVAAANLMGSNLTHQGDLVPAREWLEDALRLFKKVEKQTALYPSVIDLGVSTGGRLAHVLSHMGLVEKARAQIKATLARADALGQPFARMMALFYGCITEVRFENVQGVRTLSEAMQKVVADNGFVQGDPLWRWLRGWAHVQEGEFDQGYALVIDGYQYHQRISMLAGATSVLAHAAFSASRAGCAVEARRHVDEGFALAGNTGERLFLTDLMLARAEIERAAGDLGAARLAIEGAIRESQKQHAAWLELEARVALCELDGARPGDFQALAGHCRNLTEGHDTPLFRKALQLST